MMWALHGSSLQPEGRPSQSPCQSCLWQPVQVQHTDVHACQLRFALTGCSQEARDCGEDFASREPVRAVPHEQELSGSRGLRPGLHMHGAILEQNLCGERDSKIEACTCRGAPSQQLHPRWRRRSR